ncbi:MAG: GIY-YIG nuclease family protein [Bacteroidales bacterium]|nr:GIY-YIG nuclease family protein [Bacteroidales bacterium]
MPYYVYIIFSQSVNEYYKGVSEDPLRRFTEHNSNKSRHTALKGPWVLVYLHSYETKRDALIEELRLKRLKVRSIEKLIQSEMNSVKDFNKQEIG